ncbi:MAG: RNA polymerase sigma factor [Pseudomonadales bacterium]|nr:RNA polymerase sigma factor [Pseudomonadales bacterium]
MDIATGMTAEEGLIRRAQAGDRVAFSELVAGQYDLIYRFALKFSGRIEDAEDIAQQACIKLAQSIGRFRFESALSTWLYTLVLSCARDWEKSQSKHRFPDSPLDDPHTVDTADEKIVYLGQVLDRIDAMGDGFREAIVLVVGEGMSHAEAATILAVKESTVSWRVHEVRRRLGELAAEDTDER